MLTCRRETGNIEDPYAVAVIKDENDATEAVVGHVPRRISTMCSMFLRRDGVIVCTVVGPKRYSADLVQGGMEIPCKYLFTGKEDIVGKLQKLLPPDMIQCASKPAKHEYEKNMKRRKVDDLDITVSDIDQEVCCNLENELWVKCGSYSLLFHDRNKLRDGNDLSDMHMNFGQMLIKQQYPNINGLKCTLQITKRSYRYPDCERQGSFLQVIHTGGNHWVLASNVNDTVSEITVYDSLHNTVDKCTLDLLKHLLNNVHIKVFAIQPQIQEGPHDCGLFALAFCTSLAAGEDLLNIKFDQKRMRQHLEMCFENKQLTSFPKI